MGKNSEKRKIRVGITQGDINGVGYEVIIKTLVDSRIVDFCTPIVYGSSKIAAYHRRLLGIDDFNLNAIRTPDEANPKRANIINCVDDSVKVEISHPTAESGHSAVMALERATDDLKAGLIDVLVTAPINKKNIQGEEFKFPGHTEFLETKFSDGGSHGLIVMVSSVLKVAVVTGHVPLSTVYRYINVENIVDKLDIFNRSLTSDFAIHRPKIAVLGLNPHAGDNGQLGTEEQDAIVPAIKRANENGVLAFGPYPADDFFGTCAYRSFDGVLAMYHDQAQLPFKALSPDGVNFTAGLPIVRTAPDHGTSYDKAGIGETSAESFRQALYAACDIFNNRMQYLQFSSNPLPVQELREEMSGRRGCRHDFARHDNRDSRDSRDRDKDDSSAASPAAGVQPGDAGNDSSSASQDPSDQGGNE